MYFPTSGIEFNPLLLMLAAFVISLLTTPAGISGAFLLLPFQVSVLGFVGPSVSSTNLIYNILATPGGIWRYIREGRMVWPMAWLITLGTLPGVFVGALLRSTYLSEPRAFKFFVGLVLLFLGTRQLYTTIRHIREGQRTRVPSTGGNGITMESRVSRAGEVSQGELSLKHLKYNFQGKTFSVGTIPVFTLSLAVGVVGGIYGIGGGAIIAPFLVGVLGLPVYTVAGAALMGTLLTSIAGVACFQVLDAAGIGAQSAVGPDWLLGVFLGTGGLAGTYVGARVQKSVPETWIRLMLAVLITALSFSYLLSS